jgi:fatty-acyl-CoA synthase
MYDVLLTSSYFPAQTDAKIRDITVGELLREVATDHPDIVAMADIDDAGNTGQQ